MRSLRNCLAFVAVLLVAPALPGAAGAHVEMTTSEAPAGKPVNLALEIGHGCDGASTVSLQVQVPAQASEVKAQATDGWKASTNGSTMTWQGGPLADHDVQEYPFRATLSGKKGQVLEFPAIQKCEGGASTAWIQSGQGGAEPEHPAPTVTLTSSAAAPVADTQAQADQVAEEDAAATGEPTATAGNAEDSSSEDDGGDGKTLLLIVIAGLAIGTVAGIVVRARRKQ